MNLHIDPRAGAHTWRLLLFLQAGRKGRSESHGRLAFVFFVFLAFFLSCVHTHALLKCLPGGLSAAAATAAAADGAGVVIFNDGEAEPGEAASSPAAVLPTQRSNVTLVLA